MSRTKTSGDQGEALAGRYLEARGYALLERQWRCRYGELDLVARSPEGVLCFGEVKRRGPGAIGLPREFVDGRKRERLRRAAAAYKRGVILSKLISLSGTKQPRQKKRRAGPPGRRGRPPTA